MEFLSQEIVVDGTLEDILDLFHEKGLTDGLPIVPPTVDRVERVIQSNGRDPQELIGAVPPRMGEATVEKIAVNAVMAGCLPEHLPVVVAAVRAVVQREFNLYAIQTTTHPCTPLVIVNGPIAKRLKINSGANCFGQGWRANATIGRALRLALLNIGGANPNGLDKATFGHPGKYSYCVAENEEKNPWSPLHVERGFDRDADVVTVVGAEAPHNVNDHIGKSAQGILTTMAHTMATMGSNNAYCFGEPLVVLGPEHAATISKDGWTKEDVKRFLFENARIPLRRWRLGGMAGMQYKPKWFHELDDEALIPIAERHEDIMVMVAGGAGKHSMVVPTFGVTRAVSVRVE
jgi:hypothetical protein